MNKFAGTAFLVLALLAVGFRATHHPVYGNCHQTIDGHVCTLLKWQANK